MDEQRTEANPVKHRRRYAAEEQPRCQCGGVLWNNGTRGDVIHYKCRKCGATKAQFHPKGKDMKALFLWKWDAEVMRWISEGIASNHETNASDPRRPPTRPPLNRQPSKITPYCVVYEDGTEQYLNDDDI